MSDFPVLEGPQISDYEVEVCSVIGMDVSLDSGLVLMWAECPHCTGSFAVDWTFIDQVNDIVHCPMCLSSVQFREVEEEEDVVEVVHTPEEFAALLVDLKALTW